MFTGIVESIGRVLSREGRRLVVRPRKRFDSICLGESVSVDGVCLTVEGLRGSDLIFRLLPETLRASTLGRLAVGARVNLERSLRAGDRLGGHLLLGHVDGRGVVISRAVRRGTLTLEIRLSPALGSLLVPKGPVSVDGVSLTLDDQIRRNRFRVHLVEHTLSRTTLGEKIPGKEVNLELDLVLKYLRGML